MKVKKCLKASLRGRRLDPPARLRGLDAARRRGRLALRREQSEAGRARARHARQRQPDSRRSAASTRAITGWSFSAAGSRSLPWADRYSMKASNSSGRLRARAAAFAAPGFSLSIAKASLVETSTPGLTSTAASFGIASGADRISPMPRIRRERGSTQTGTSAPIRRATLNRRGSSSGMRLARASRRNAAAASDDPPPSPAATGSACPA